MCVRIYASRDYSTTVEMPFSVTHVTLSASLLDLILRFKIIIYVLIDRSVVDRADQSINISNQSKR